MAGFLVHLLRHRELDGVPLDSPARVMLHRAILTRKRILRRVYDNIHHSFVPFLPLLPEGVRVELGSAWSHLHEVVPGLVRTDIAPVEGARIRVDAQRLPFADGSLAGIFMINSLHHIPDSILALREAARVLRPGGILMLAEPHVTRWSLRVWGISKHEHYNLDSQWTFRTSGPLSGSDMAIPWKIFTRDLGRFHREFPGLEILHRGTHTCFTFLLSGGFSMKSLVPSWCYAPLQAIDKGLSWMTGGASDQFETIIVRKIGSP